MIDCEAFARYAKAEKELCEEVGPLLAQAIQKIEDKHGIRVAEVRVTVDRAGLHSWSGANCVLIREAQSDANDQKTAMAGRKLTASNAAVAAPIDS